MGNVDSLSRLPTNQSSDIEDLKINYFSQEENLVDCHTVQEKTSEDKVLKLVYKYVMYGWPVKESLSEKLKFYYLKRYSLSTESNCLYYINRIIIPNDLRCQMLKLLYDEAHIHRYCSHENASPITYVVAFNR